jgi:hypothetical protein
MHKIFALASIVLLASAVSPALADDGEHDCTQGSRPTSITADAMRTKIDELGYQVRRLHTEDGCFKAYIVDRESGGTVKATFSATTGELVRARLGS